MKRLWLLMPAGILLLCACARKPASQSAGNSRPEAPSGSLELVFPYGSEKENWITEVTDAFNRGQHKLPDGTSIFVRAIPMGSGETIDEILAGRLQAHIASPASAAFIKLGNAESRTKLPATT